MKRARGIVGGEVGFDHQRIAPPDELDGFVEHFWSVRWSLPAGERHSQSVLSHPSVHVVFESDGAAYAQGPSTARFTRVLSGEHGVFAAKLEPGAARVVLGRDAHVFTDAKVALGGLVGEADAITRRVLDAEEVGARVEALGAWLVERARPLPEDAVFSAAVVEAMREDASLTSVALASERFDCSVRTLQRLFRRWVGVSPKWVIGRYRLHEAMEALEREPNASMAELAHRLGYFDQSHFTRDFHSLVGESPARYARAFSRDDGS